MKNIMFSTIFLLQNTLNYAYNAPKIYNIGQQLGHYTERNGTAIDTLVMHYTEKDLENTLKIFLDPEKKKQKDYYDTRFSHYL